ADARLGCQPLQDAPSHRVRERAQHVHLVRILLVHASSISCPNDIGLILYSEETIMYDASANEVLDEGLTRLAATGPEFRGGLSNHGPMAAEAMVRLGRADAVEGWLGGYLRRAGG